MGVIKSLGIIPTIISITEMLTVAPASAGCPTTGSPELNTAELNDIPKIAAITVVNMYMSMSFPPILLMSEASAMLVMPAIIEKNTTGAIIMFNAFKNIVRMLVIMFLSMKDTTESGANSFSMNPAIIPRIIAARVSLN